MVLATIKRALCLDVSQFYLQFMVLAKILFKIKYHNVDVIGKFLSRFKYLIKLTLKSKMDVVKQFQVDKRYFMEGVSVLCLNQIHPLLRC